MRSLFLMLVCVMMLGVTRGQTPQQSYCNPMNLDYGFTPIPNFAEAGKHRATADPVITFFKDDYYLFSTNQKGYWWSHDLCHWNFISHSFLLPEHKVYDDLCAPAVWIQGDTLLVFGSTYTSTFPIWMSTQPKTNQWTMAAQAFKPGGWDPDFFLDEDGRLYFYHGSSNTFPLYGVEIDRHTFLPIGAERELYRLNEARFGWQRFGEYLDNTFLNPFIEGSWMTKHSGKYFLQYGAPGTEFSGYADGVAVANQPLGPFEAQPHNPFSYKPGGFARGAGHGSTFQDRYGNWWHVSTIAISVKNNFERRLGLWPAGFDKDNVLYANTAFGDWPHWLPKAGNKILFTENHTLGTFTGWMLLNYNKPVRVSSTLGGFEANYAVDENIKTYWSAQSDHPGEWIQSDLGSNSTVYAVQINYADQDATLLGKANGIYHRYRLYSSTDEKNWKILVDKSSNTTDVPHDYVELSRPVQARYVKLVNVHMATGKFAISGLRVFGYGGGEKPDTVKRFVVLRTASDKRSAWIKWQSVDKAFAYNIYTGVAPDKLYNCIMVYGANEYYFKGMDRELPYYFQIEAINENGTSKRTTLLRSD